MTSRARTTTGKVVNLGKARGAARPESPGKVDPRMIALVQALGRAAAEEDFKALQEGRQVARLTGPTGAGE